MAVDIEVSFWTIVHAIHNKLRVSRSTAKVELNTISMIQYLLMLLT